MYEEKRKYHYAKEISRLGKINVGVTFLPFVADNWLQLAREENNIIIIKQVERDYGVNPVFAAGLKDPNCLFFLRIFRKLFSPQFL